MTITAPLIRALEQISRQQPAPALLVDRILSYDLIERDKRTLTPLGRAILQAYRIGRRRWGAT